MILSRKVSNFKIPSGYPVSKTVTHNDMELLFASPGCVLILNFRKTDLYSGFLSNVASGW